MKVIIPENIADITLRQFQEIVEFTDKEGVSENEIKAEKIKIFAKLSYKQIESISKSDFDSLVNSIDEALNKPAEFEKTFEMNGIEFGFHPNLDAMNTSEYTDLMTYSGNTDELHKLIAILFRPITTKDRLGNYKIGKYDGTSEYAEYMKETPLHIVNGALVFFFHLSRELRSSILRYSEADPRKVRKHQIFGLSGGGMPQS